MSSKQKQWKACLHNSIPREKVGFLSLIALRIHTLSAEASIIFSQGRWLDLSWLFHSFLFTWSCCPNNHCFGEHFAGSLNVFSDVLGGFVWLCLAKVEQSYPNMVKLGKGLPLNPALSWAFSAWTGNVSHSLILERKCQHYSLPIACNQTVLLLFINKQMNHYNSLFQ